MFVIEARNVNDAYFKGLNLLLNDGVKQPSRAGEVLVMPTPVTTVYNNPTERVLFDPKRDANPFFHLFESLWMLAGLDDATWLDRFVGDFSSRFAEDGVQHGAYGHRWREDFGFDQLDAVVERLRVNPTDRQCVIQMWDARCDEFISCDDKPDWTVGKDDLLGNWKDRPCNTHLYLRIRNQLLDITVCCRSNDAVWGAYGANAVHFSVLQEYLAARIGVGVGRYYQISNNFHVYTGILPKVLGERDRLPPIENPYATAPERTVQPLVTDPDKFDSDLKRFMVWTNTDARQEYPYAYNNKWFSHTAEPLYVAHMRWKAKDREGALHIINDSLFNIAPDWRLAAKAWMERRMAKTKEEVQNVGK